MDWRISFIPSDVHDLTTAERDKRVNPKVVINIHTTNQLKGIIIPAVVQNIAFRGHMRVKIHFMNKFPYARLFEASFLDKPVFDYDLAPLGTNVLGFDINYASTIVTKNRLLNRILRLCLDTRVAKLRPRSSPCHPWSHDVCT